MASSCRTLKTLEYPDNIRYNLLQTKNKKISEKKISFNFARMCTSVVHLCGV